MSDNFYPKMIEDKTLRINLCILFSCTTDEDYSRFTPFLLRVITSKISRIVDKNKNREDLMSIDKEIVEKLEKIIAVTRQKDEDWGGSEAYDYLLTNIKSLKRELQEIE